MKWVYRSSEILKLYNCILLDVKVHDFYAGSFLKWFSVTSEHMSFVCGCVFIKEITVMVWIEIRGPPFSQWWIVLYIQKSLWVLTLLLLLLLLLTLNQGLWKQMQCVWWHCQDRRCVRQRSVLFRQTGQDCCQGLDVPLCSAADWTVFVSGKAVTAANLDSFGRDRNAYQEHAKQRRIAEREARR